MSTYDDASLVLVPSGYKNGIVFSQKPMDANGQLTFTRASSATRVQSDGLIEKVRTNLVLQSNTFNTTWTLSNSALTSGQSGYDGTTNAWLLTKNAGFGSVFQASIAVATSTPYSFSCYMKANASGSGSLRLFTNATGFDFRVVFNLTTGAIATASANNGTRLGASATDVGNGWWRVSVSGLTSGTAATVNIYAGDTAAVSGSIFIQDAMLEIGDVMTEYVGPTTTAAVSVGPVSGLPRLDYLGSTCPRLLLEPSSTTLLTFSEQLDNAAWDKTSGGSAITANSVTSPDGYTNADTITGTGAGVAFVLVRQTLTVAAAGTYTFSGFFKYNNHPFVSLNLSAYDGGGNANYNIQTGVVTNVSAGSTAKIENYGNGWYRCSLTSAIGATDLTGRPSIYVANDGTTSDFPNVAAATGKAAYAWGFNMCLGSYVQSYIPTLGASVTRVKDIASKTGISSLIGQTEGTLFAEVMISELQGAVARTILAIEVGTSRVQLFFTGLSANTLRALVREAGATKYDARQTITTTGTIKLAIAYKSLDSAFYVNGVEVTNVLTNLSFGTINFSDVLLGNADTNVLDDRIAQALLFKTRLTNDQLAELTSL
jgi:hypothetical protein